MLPNISNKNFVDDLLATLKAVSKKENIKLEIIDAANDFFLLNQAIVNEEKIIIPKTSNIKQGRFGVDLAACYLLFHNEKIHQENAQEFFNQERQLFDDFEKMRVIAGVQNLYAGILKNITQKIRDDAKSRFLDDYQALPLLFLQDFLDKKLVDISLEKIDKKIQNHFTEIAKNINDQQKFAAKIQQFIEFLRKQNEAQQKQEEKTPQNPKKSESKQENDDVNFNEESQPQKAVDETGQDQQENKQALQEEEKIQMPQLGETGLDAMQIKAAAPPNMEEKIEFKKAYHVFTNKFDEIVIPQKLVNKNELEVLRYGLDLRISRLQGISKRLALKLKKKLLAKKQYHIEHSDSVGVLDRRRFTQLIIDPDFSNIFIDEKQHEYHDTIVTILLDNSGSMRGSPIVMSAMACEIIASILEKFSIKTEILGFTTSDWKGGKSRKLWEAQNRPENPGRLSDLRHIIYKSAGQNLKKAKVNLGLMLKEGLLKENIDGEALLWARSRLMQRSEKRKILMIISDGTPVDDSTNSVNESEILIDHLHHVIHLIEKHSKIEIVGIGIGHHVDNFYRNSISIKSVEDLGDVMIEKIVDLI